jgi:predicted nucleic acid-binding protein
VAQVRTFVDADVLIWAARGQEPLSIAAIEILVDADREFIVSEFLRLEVLPKAVYNRKQPEEQFYRRFLAAASIDIPTATQLTSLAEDFACRYGLSAVDSLHVAAAQLGGAKELITAERPTSPLFRVQELRIISIRPTVSAGIE